jgi:hypothetical protein
VVTLFSYRDAREFVLGFGFEEQNAKMILGCTPPQSYQQLHGALLVANRSLCGVKVIQIYLDLHSTSPQFRPALDGCERLSGSLAANALRGSSFSMC